MYRIKELRKQHGMTQKQAAALFDVSYSLYSKWEVGDREPVSKDLQKIADYYGVTIDYLLGRVEKPLDYFGAIPTKQTEFLIEQYTALNSADKGFVDRLIKRLYKETVGDKEADNGTADMEQFGEEVVTKNH